MDLNDTMMVLPGSTKMVNLFEVEVLHGTAKLFGACLVFRQHSSTQSQHSERLFRVSIPAKVEQPVATSAGFFGT